MAKKWLKGRVISDQPNKYRLKIQPNKYMSKRLMLKGKKRLKGRILSVQPNKYLLERLMLKGKKWMLKEEEDKEDMLSKLPDEIVQLIMCCLTMEEAATMSLVSRRCLKIWKTIIQTTPRLAFNVNKIDKNKLEKGCSERDLTNEKINAVNKTLKLHKAATLDEFLLSASKLKSEDCHHINAWTDFAAKKHVKKLTLQLNSNIGYDTTFVADNFHCLRDLHMDGIKVTQNFIDRLFSKSPFLERLSLRRTGQIHELKIVSAPNLKCLQLRMVQKLQHLEISSSAAKNLNTLEITVSSTLKSISIPFAPNLSHLILGINEDFKFDIYCTLLDQINALTLDIRVFTKMMSGQFPQFPQLSKVEHLELKLGLPCFNIPIHRLPDFLKAAPFLNTFSVEFGYSFIHPSGDNALKWLDKLIPKKVKVNRKHSCQYLKVVKLDDFSGCQYQVEFVLHLLKYALMVEKIIIQLMPSSIWKEQNNWNYEDKIDNRYEELCLGCARLLKTKILQMHSTADVVII